MVPRPNVLAPRLSIPAKLNVLMDKYKTNYFTERLMEQSEYYTNNFSWKKRYLEWINLFNKF